MEKIIKNAIRCKNCGDVIESESRRDFKYCSCKRVAVEGGHSYLIGLSVLGSSASAMQTRIASG